MTRGLSEADVEETALHWLRGLGWQVKYGPDLACGMPQAERSDPGYRDVILEGRLRDALARLHSRAKPNEQERRDTRPVMEADAEYALAAMGLLLRELGWTV
ncbi:protein containing Restriction endonuclease, type I, EcoRI, R subunit/Type III, Res subunit [mine drainage metagenome]|uniref:Protein containing Restriction endonuclease, type I, EcoRI, R subunit/Type III, Res subunit n=1 Tax=mine drainage metagenome TaxID=410659 RepID=T0YXA0_9ZZZZ